MRVVRRLTVRLQAKAVPARPPEAPSTGLRADGAGSPFDDAYVGELRAALGTDRVDQLLELLDRECADKPAVIRDLVRAGAIEEVRRAAHSLKGAASGIGAVALARAAQRLELVPGKAAAGRLLGQLDREALRTRAGIALVIGGGDRLRAG